MKNKKLQTVTRTALLVALLIVFQWGLGALTGGNQLVVGSAVNLVLIVAASICGLDGGLSVAVISPFLAKLVGIGPLWSLVPLIAIGNAVLVVVWFFIAGDKFFKKLYAVRLIASAVAGALLKALALYLMIAKAAVPILLGQGAIIEKQATVLSASFGIIQLFTALIGGALAVLLLPVLKKAIK